jgi:hypothetical protein
LFQTIFADAAPQTKIVVQMKGINGSKTSQRGRVSLANHLTSRGAIAKLKTATKKVGSSGHSMLTY